MSQKNKLYILILIVLVIALFIKSFILDDYNPKNELESDFKTKVEEIVDGKYDNVIYSKGLIKIRIVKISKMSEKERSVVDDEGNSYIANGIYKAKIRKYILGVLPYAEERILDINLD